ncbi:hypothetical protein AAG906_009895 [Vitis piasezkii]
MSQLKQMSHLDNIPSTTRKFKMERRLRWHCSLAKLTWGGPAWKKRVRSSAKVRARNGISVLVTGAAGFVGTHVSAALKRRGDGVVGLDNFNDYYDPSLKRARQALLERTGVFIVEGDINDSELLRKLFEVVAFTHVMHLAAQAGVRYAMENPSSYVHSNIAGLVNLLEVCKSANPQPAIVWASSSSVYGLNTKVPFSERDRTDQPASLYAATKKAGEEIAHTYNHIYGLSLTGLRFFTVYGPWGRPDMAYFFFTKDILKGKSIRIFEAPNHGTVARDFTYIDDIVKGCVAALDTAEKSTGSGGKKKGQPIEGFQFGQHITGSSHGSCEHFGETLEGEGKKNDDEDAKEWGCAVYPCQHQLGSKGARIQAHNRSANRFEEIC